jgi:hypothetical protein
MGYGKQGCAEIEVRGDGRGRRPPSAAPGHTPSGPSGHPRVIPGSQPGDGGRLFPSRAVEGIAGPSAWGGDVATVAAATGLGAMESGRRGPILPRERPALYG